jgi:hypothetical protein
LICVTGFGAGNSRGRGGCLYNAAFHLLLGRVYDDKDVQERIVRRSKLDWVIVRPVILTNGPKTNAYRALVDPRGWTCGFISRADVADFLVTSRSTTTLFCIRRRCSRADANVGCAGTTTPMPTGNRPSARKVSHLASRPMLPAIYQAAAHH